MAYPRYYAQMAPRNRAGVAAPDLAAHPVALAELGQRIGRGEWVVDVRSRRAFAARHLAGTVNVEWGGQLATYLGWVFPWGAPLSLLAETDEQLVAARRGLSHIGLDDIVAESTATGVDLARAGRGPVVPGPSSFAKLDARRLRGDTLRA